MLNDQFSETLIALTAFEILAFYVKNDSGRLGYGKAHRRHGLSRLEDIVEKLGVFAFFWTTKMRTTTRRRRRRQRRRRKERSLKFNCCRQVGTLSTSSDKWLPWPYLVVTARFELPRRRSVARLTSRRSPQDGANDREAILRESLARFWATPPSAPYSPLKPSNVSFFQPSPQPSTLGAFPPDEKKRENETGRKHQKHLMPAFSRRRTPAMRNNHPIIKALTRSRLFSIAVYFPNMLDDTQWAPFGSIRWNRIQISFFRKTKLGLLAPLSMRFYRGGIVIRMTRELAVNIFLTILLFIFILKTEKKKSSSPEICFLKESQSTTPVE